MQKPLIIITFLLLSLNLFAEISKDIIDVEAKVIEWRRDFHQHPELSNREFRTAKIIAEHLKSLGLEVRTGVAHTGVTGFLKGALPGPTIALRADMDALPVTEQVDLPFASKQTTTYRGETVGVMHACGHDTHVAMLMGAAEVLAKNKANLKGSVLFVFQPAEEGAPEGERGGAEMMLSEGIFSQYKPEVAFGIHITSSIPSGVAGYHAGPAMAAVDTFDLTVHGKQTHGSRPWGGIDPIVASAQIINAVQTIVSRKVDVTKAAAVVSFGAIKGGIRSNIIPDKVEMVGTIRNFDMEIRDMIHENLRQIVENTARASGATAELVIHSGYPVTVNNPELTKKMLPSLQAVFGDQSVIDMGMITGAEDFSYYAQQVPGFFFYLGVTPHEIDYRTAPTNHSPLFYVEESNLINGVKAFVQLVQDYE
ncbi:MAG TPA: amidohydrolase [Oceanospirillales bacterium]|nr:amidohydrolase [Oceanospirillales bacterium]